MEREQTFEAGDAPAGDDDLHEAKIALRAR
jgi:hypothetical protein